MALNNTISIFGSYEVGGTPTWFGTMLVMGFWTFLLGFLAIFLSISLSSFDRYKKSRKIIRWLANSFSYFGYGTLALIFLSIPCGIAYWMFSNAKAGNVMPLWVTGIIIGGYFAIVLLGYIFKTWIIDKIKTYENQLNKNKKKKKKDDVVYY